MNAPSSSPAPFVWRGYSALRWAVIILTGITLFRFWLTTRLELVPDEAYYWLWSENLALSYRDKGPLIGWTIALSTWLFDDTAFAIRFFAVALGTGIGWQIFRLFLMPFCVSSFAALVKDAGYVLIFPPTLRENLLGGALIAGFVALTLLLKRTHRAWKR